MQAAPQPGLKAFTRFTLVVAAGLLVDLVIAWLLSLHMAIVAAAAIGFAAGALSNYLAHNFWTFRHGNARPRMSLRQFAFYLAVLGITLAIRLALVALLSGWLGTGSLENAVVLIAASGASFLVNFVLSRQLVFTVAPGPEGR